MKKYKAQQIIEFLLAAPLMIIIFAVLTEFAFALNTQFVLTNTLKSSVSAYNYKMEDIANGYEYPNGDKVKAYIKDNLKAALGDSFDESLLSIQFIRVEDNHVVSAEYTYKPGFTFSFFPALREIKMSSVAVFPYTIKKLKSRGIDDSAFSVCRDSKLQYQPRCEGYCCERDYSRCRAWVPVTNLLGIVVGYKCVDWYWKNVYDDDDNGIWWCVDMFCKERLCPATKSMVPCSSL